MSNNVIHVIEATATGTLEIAKLMVSCLHDEFNIWLIYSRRPETPVDIQNLFPPNVKLIEINMGGAGLLFAFYKLRKLIRMIQPTHIHLHSSFAGFIGRISTLGIRSPKIFYSPHCISLMRSDIGYAKKFFFRFLEQLANRKRSKYVACSESERQAILDAIPDAKVHLIENAVDIDTTSPISKKTCDNKVVITAGGIRPQKDPRMFADIASKLSGPSLKFMWIGDGDPKLKQLLIDANVHVTGWLNRAETIELLCSADIYLSTSAWEGMPVSLIEALLLELDIVARKVPGNCDVIKNDEYGQTFISSSEAIRTITDLAKGGNCHFDPSLAKSRFSKSRFKAELLHLYSLP